MITDYTKSVLKFGGTKPYQGEDGKGFNLSHDEDIDPKKVKTNSAGDVIDMPLLRRKPCFGRPERFIRGYLPDKTWYDSDGDRRFQRTRCDQCRELSSGTNEACHNLVMERIETASTVRATFDAWFESCDGQFGVTCYVRQNGKLWHEFLQSIIDHGGWTNVNNDAKKLDAIERQRLDNAKRSKTRKASRLKVNAARRGIPVLITSKDVKQLRAERDRRVEHLKGLRKVTAAGRWLARLPDAGCERMADVWEARELLTCAMGKCNGTTIAKYLVANGAQLSVASLTSRVYEDLKRIAKLESGLAGLRIWEDWSPVADPKAGSIP